MLKEMRAMLGLPVSTGGRRTINKAIREWCIGGDDLIESIELVNRLHTRLKERSLPGHTAAGEALQKLIEVKDVMTDHVFAKVKQVQREAEEEQQAE